MDNYSYSAFEQKDGGAPAPTNEVKTALEGLAKTFEEFKFQNDKRLEEIAKKGAADVVTKEQVEKLNDEITRLTQVADDLQKKAARSLLDGSGKEISADQAEHQKAFMSFLRKGKDEGLQDLERKALSIGSNPDGGFALPKVIDTNLEKLTRDISPVRQVAQVVQVSTTDYNKLVDINGTASGWVGETAARPDTASEKLANVKPTMGELYANPRATQTSLDDMHFDGERWLAESIAEQFAVAEAAAFISGDGVNKPTGFLSGPAPLTTGDATRAFGTLQYTPSGAAAAMPANPDVFIDLVHSLRAPYRQGAVFMMRSTVLAALRKYKDTAGQYLWQPSLQAGAPASFLGYPVFEAEDMPAIAANAFPIAFGNFMRGYLIADRIGTRVLRDPYTDKPNVSFYTTKRVGGIVQNSEAIKLLRISTT